MYVRKYDGTIVKINMSTIHNDVDFYTKLWKIKYNIDIENKFVLNDQFIAFKKKA